ESKSETITKVVSETTESKQIVDQSEKKLSEVDAKAKTSSICDPQVPQPVITKQNNTDISQTAENINDKCMVNYRNESKENKQTYSSIFIHKPINLKNRVPINACANQNGVTRLSHQKKNDDDEGYTVSSSGQWSPKVDQKKVYQLISTFANIIRLEELSPNIPNRYFRSFKLTVESHFDYAIREGKNWPAGITVSEWRERNNNRDKATRENESVNHKACIADSDKVDHLNQSLVVNEEDVLEEEDDEENQHGHNIETETNNEKEANSISIKLKVLVKIMNNLFVFIIFNCTVISFIMFNSTANNLLQNNQLQNISLNFMKNHSQSNINFDCWKSYERIKLLEKNFTHLTVDHDLYFVNPKTDVHTNGIDSIWCTAKTLLKKMRGVNRSYLQSYLDEFCWRHNQSLSRAGSFGAILSLISKNLDGDNIDDITAQLSCINFEDE
ncbi:unnamed protein product, partial [Brachionus calyciflorus]